MTAPTTPPGPITITVHGVPAPQGSKRHVGNGRMIESSKKVRPWREAVKYAAFDARAAAGFAHRFAPDAPLAVTATFVFHKPKSAPKRRRTWPVTRASGDVDKLLRSTLDALTDAGTFKDDSQVIHVTGRKVFTDDPAAPLTIPGAHITVRDLTTEGTQ